VVVADALRERILCGALPGGERLRQDAIANRFGVSQMIVREAFKQLVTEGFLSADIGGGLLDGNGFWDTRHDSPRMGSGLSNRVPSRHSECVLRDKIRNSKIQSI
jgi:DNA-binding FadR family transcriptional regulator